MSQKVTLIYGDGIGPEVVGATREIIDASGAGIEWEVCEAGEKVFEQGLETGVPQETVESIKRNRIALKGPLATPVGFGQKSANVTLRKMFETYGNIRPVREMPGVKTPFTGRNIDLVIVRENVEDLYAGIEYMQTPDVAECLKLISRSGCEKIVRLAFEFARSNGRKLVHCATKANIMKLTEGLLKRTFEEIAENEYPDIESRHIIVDNCAHMLVKQPENFDVIVTTNMNGDILSDLSSALVGGLGFAPGANLGDDIAIFEAVHGSAPKYAGKNNINPTAVLLSGVMMLRHLGKFTEAEAIEQALLYTMAIDNKLTRDAVGDANAVSTTEFTNAIIGNLGKDYEGNNKREHKHLSMPKSPSRSTIDNSDRYIAGLDVFVEANEEVQELGKSFESICQDSPFQLKLISSRGVKVYPLGDTQPDVGNFFCCRLTARENGVDDDAINGLVQKITAQHHWMHIEKLTKLGDRNGFSKTHGEE